MGCSTCKVLFFFFFGEGVSVFIFFTYRIDWLLDCGSLERDIQGLSYQKTTSSS